MSRAKTIAVIGSGVAGISAVWHLDPSIKVIFYEINSRLGGHTHTHTIEIEDEKISVDSGFIVFNKPNYPNFIKWLEILKVEWARSNMSFSFSLDNGSFEWSGKSLSSVFAQKSNFFSLKFYNMLFEINKFNKLGIQLFHNPSAIKNLTIEQFLKTNKFGDYFIERYLYPMASSIWSSPQKKITNFPAVSLITFFYNHGLLRLTNHFDWYSIKGGSNKYIDKFLESMLQKKRNFNLKLNHEVKKINFAQNGKNNYQINIAGLKKDEDTTFETTVDGVILACHSNDSSKIIFEEHPSQKLLKKINFQENVATLHLDTSLMPKIKNVWSAWNYNSLHNFESCSDLPVVSYWMNTLQDLQTSQNIFVTLNSENNIRKDLVIKSMKYEHPLFDIDSKIAQSNFKNVQGIKNIWFAGAWLGHGFHEDGFISGKSAAVEVNNKFVTG
ncbi:MAG: hypothetical protein CBD16_08665 [Betaproteobacteria bacterium TMED156]|nr:MAG: hypothetical protein CBD16_08665 [Betaproteobacteria bacterium TMED156]